MIRACLKESHNLDCIWELNFVKKNALIIIAHTDKSMAVLLIYFYQSLQLGAICKVSQWLLLCSCFYSVLWLLWSDNEDEECPGWVVPFREKHNSPAELVFNQ